LEAMYNPDRRKDYDKKELLKDVKLHKVNYYESGMGNLSHTFNKVSLGVFSAGKWIAEETVILGG
jgi:hypothetical protein